MATTNTQFASMQQLQAYLMQASSYKPARKKQYTIWCCMPAIGTKVHNTLEDANYATNEKQRFVLSGTRGEMWVINVDKLAKTYTFGDGTPITPQSLKAKQKDGVIDWFQVKTITDNDATLFATFVPAKYQFQVQTSWGAVLNANRVGIPHGKGDFVLCGNNNGYPNVNDKWVVNGAVFADTYDNRGWGEYLDTTNSVEGAPPKPTVKVTASKDEGDVMNFANQLVAAVEAKYAGELGVTHSVTQEGNIIRCVVSQATHGGSYYDSQVEGYVFLINTKTGMILGESVYDDAPSLKNQAYVSGGFYRLPKDVKAIQNWVMTGTLPIGAKLASKKMAGVSKTTWNGDPLCTTSDWYVTNYHNTTRLFTQDLVEQHDRHGVQLQEVFRVPTEECQGKNANEIAAMANKKGVTYDICGKLDDNTAFVFWVNVGT